MTKVGHGRKGDLAAAESVRLRLHDVRRLERVLTKQIVKPNRSQLIRELVSRGLDVVETEMGLPPLDSVAES